MYTVQYKFLSISLIMLTHSSDRIFNPMRYTGMYYLHSTGMMSTSNESSTKETPSASCKSNQVFFDSPLRVHEVFFIFIRIYFPLM